MGLRVVRCRSVIILIISKLDSRFAVVQFCNHSYDYRPNRTPLSPITIINWTLACKSDSCNHAVGWANQEIWAELKSQRSHSWQWLIGNGLCVTRCQPVIIVSARSSNFVITRMIADQIGLHSVLLPSFVQAHKWQHYTLNCERILPVSGNLAWLFGPRQLVSPFTVPQEHQATHHHL